MDIKVLLWFLLPLFGLSVSTENVTELFERQKFVSKSNVSYLNDNVPHSPQLSIIEKIVPAYELPKNIDFEQFFDIKFRNNENTKNLTSSNYPKPYPVNEAFNYSASVENSTGIDIILHSLNIDPVADFLKLSNVPIDSTTPNHIILTGKINEPIKFRLFGSTSFNLEFGSYTKKINQYSGFLLTYEPSSDIQTTITNPPDVTISLDKLETITKLIVVKKSNQIPDTWSSLKQILCNATNNYLNESHKIAFLESCGEQNITFTSIVECPSDWPDYLDCVEISLRILLNPNDSYVEEIIPKSPIGLNSTELNKMWDNFGRNLLIEEGYPEYTLPNATEQILLWVGIAIGCLLVVFIIAVAAFKLGIPNKLRINTLEDNQRILKNSHEMGITLCSSQDQIVPELFPNGVGSQFYGQTNSYSNSCGRKFEPDDVVGNFCIMNEEKGDFNPAFVYDEENEDQKLRLNHRCRLKNDNQHEDNK